MTRKLKLVSAGIGVAAMLGIMGASSFAIFTASNSISATQDSADSTFLSGTLGITSAFSAPTGSNSSDWVVTRTGPDMHVAIDNMAPGDTDTRYLTITNTGTLSEYYNVTVNTTNSLFSNDNNYNGTFEKKSEAFVSVALPLTDNATGYPILSDVYDQGTQNGSPSQWILLKSGESETLAVTVQLPIKAGNAFQGLEGNFTIDMNSQQGANIAAPSLTSTQASNIGTGDAAIVNAVEMSVAQ